jgi:hypothetical protein
MLDRGPTNTSARPGQQPFLKRQENLPALAIFPFFSLLLPGLSAQSRFKNEVAVIVLLGTAGVGTAEVP